ncbi:unnamed protein product [Arabidopsis lyrata]|nr:unnamed protein product [Arabidopsis lyrata]
MILPAQPHLFSPRLSQTQPARISGKQQVTNLLYVMRLESNTDPDVTGFFDGGNDLGLIQHLLVPNS